MLRIEELVSNGTGPCSLSIAPGECVCISGPSGAGKSLLLRAVADLDPHHGKVYLDEIECNDTSPVQWRRHIGLLPAESQWWHDTVGEHLEDVDISLLSALGFSQEVLAFELMRLSSGERQRLALIRLLHNKPRALLLDEPTASLDPESTRHVEQLLADYRVQNQVPVIWVSHDPAQIKRIADRHYQIVAGKLTQ